MCYFDYYLYFALELYYLIFHLVYYVYFFLQSNHIKSLIKIQSFYNYIYNFEKINFIYFIFQIRQSIFICEIEHQFIFYSTIPNIIISTFFRNFFCIFEFNQILQIIIKQLIFLFTIFFLLSQTDEYYS